MPTELEDFLEFSKPSKVDRLENGTVVLRRVKYLGARSTNRNRDGSRNVYPLAARRSSEKLYDGAKIFRDHPKDRRKPGEPRSVADQLGRLRGPFEHLEEGSYADVHLHPKHPLTERIAWSAEHSPDDLGLSHNAQGKGRRSGTDYLVESVARVRSVDLVTDGATTKGLFEGRTEDYMDPKERLRSVLESIRELQEQVDEAALLAILSDEALISDEKVMKALALLAAGGKTEGDDEGDAGAGADESMKEGKRETPPPAKAHADPAVVELQEQLRRQALEIDAFKAKQASEELRAKRVSQIQASNLPQSALSEVFLEAVYEADDDEKAKSLIEDRRRLWFKQDPRSGGSGRGESTVKNAGDFLAGKKG